jgi:uncharacterized coiled-coil protein SlyX
MKSKLLMAAVALILMSSCGQKKEENSNAERDSLVAVLNERDASLNEYLSVTNDIEANLDSIVRREGSIKMTAGKGTEINPSQKERINADVTAINDLMKQNRDKINSLTKKLKHANSQMAANEKMIQTLNERLSSKDQELAALRDELMALKIQVENLETSVSNLTAENTAQSQTIDQQTASMHTAYYVVGKSKELRDKKIINKTGGLLGIGKTSQLQPNIDNSMFNQIDYTKVEVIAVNSGNPKMITSHPKDSYTFDKQENKFTNLHITNPEKFWSASKYLVIVTD